MYCIWIKSLFTEVTIKHTHLHSMWAKCRVLILNQSVRIVNSAFKTLDKERHYLQPRPYRLLRNCHLSEWRGFYFSGSQIPDCLCEPSFLMDRNLVR